jgi:hypothetical protein
VTCFSAALIRRLRTRQESIILRSCGMLKETRSVFDKQVPVFRKSQIGRHHIVDSRVAPQMRVAQLKSALTMLIRLR